MVVVIFVSIVDKDALGPIELPRWSDLLQLFISDDLWLGWRHVNVLSLVGLLFSLLFLTVDLEIIVAGGHGDTPLGA